MKQWIAKVAGGEHLTADEIMGVRHKKFAGTAAPVEGVQFHPESIMTEAGKQLLGNFLRMGSALPAVA